MDECLRSEEPSSSPPWMTTSTPPTRWPLLFELVRAVYKLPQGGVSREAVQMGMDKMKAICRRCRAF